MPDSKGRFGIHGGQYIPETLMNAVIELEEAYNHYKNDPEFNKELTELLNEYAGKARSLTPSATIGALGPVTAKTITSAPVNAITAMQRKRQIMSGTTAS